MTTATMTTPHSQRASLIAVLARVERHLLRYGLVLVIAWIACMKFTAYEANGIQPLVAHSPLLSWAYSLTSVQGFSNALGVIELAIAAMVASRPLSARVAVAGGCLAVAMFLTTLTFLISTPGWEPTLGGFPALSTVPGQFVLKDVVLLGASVWGLRDALEASLRGTDGGSPDSNPDAGHRAT
jgi:uncharacterized membrane protein YkgB